MAEFVENAVQTVAPGAPVILDTAIACPNGYVLHRNQSGIVILRGRTNKCFARYQVTFNGNIAIAPGGTVGPIAIGLAIDGEPLPTSRAIVTPAAAEDYFNVTSTAIITVPQGCCFNVSVENVSESATPATTPAPTITVQNANMVVSRIA